MSTRSPEKSLTVTAGLEENKVIIVHDRAVESKCWNFLYVSWQQGRRWSFSCYESLMVKAQWVSLLKAREEIFLIISLLLLIFYSCRTCISQLKTDNFILNLRWKQNFFMEKKKKKKLTFTHILQNSKSHRPRYWKAAWCDEKPSRTLFPIQTPNPLSSFLHKTCFIILRPNCKLHKLMLSCRILPWQL